MDYIGPERRSIFSETRDLIDSLLTQAHSSREERLILAVFKVGFKRGAEVAMADAANLVPERREEATVGAH